MLFFQPVAVCRAMVAEDLAQLPAAHRDFDEATKHDRVVNPWRRTVVGIVTCAAHRQRLANYLAVFRDVFDHIGLAFYVIVADPELTPAGGADFAVDHGARIFTAKARESYETLAHKLAIFYGWVWRHTDYDHVIKCDDSCLLQLSRVLLDPDAAYVGAVLKATLNTIHIGKCSDPVCNATPLDFGHGFRAIAPDMDEGLYRALYDVPYASGGCGYRLNRAALQAIARYKPHVLSLELSYEDLLFGQMLHLEGIAVTWNQFGNYHAITHE